MATYTCRSCHRDDTVPRAYLYHFGDQCRCPKCGTLRVKKLKQRDKIDPMRSGVLNLLERMAGGHLFYCCFCRIQFYDRRTLAPRTTTSSDPVTTDPVTSQPDTARSGA
jgi:hypothetical protein